MQLEPPEGAPGLGTDEVLRRRAATGWNELPRAARAHPVRLFLRQFASLLVVILIVAAVIAYALGEVVDAAAITAVIVLNAAFGFVQEWRAENQLEALRSMMAPMATVIRDGRRQTIPARDLVPGDHVLVAAGDVIPADLKPLRQQQLMIDESVLTGESVPVEKSGETESERLYAGTSVVQGRAEGEVSEIGLKTEFGRIADLARRAEEPPTALQTQLSRLATQLGAAALGIAVLVVIIGLLSGRALSDIFLTGLSLAVAIVPEGLPAVVTITLALGAMAMARQKAVARRLQAVETLGAASVICTDKTGTLTENRMTATQIWMAHGLAPVTGTGYDPAGHISLSGDRVRAADDPVLARALTTAVTCTHALLSHDTDGWHMMGDPTEGALITLAYKGWVPLPGPDAILHETAFTSERKRMSVLSRAPFTLHCKGAPEQVLAICTALLTPDGPVPLSAEIRAQIEAALSDMASDGLRVIALADRPASNAGDIAERDLVLTALVGLIDPPRASVPAAVAAAGSAGIRVVMITGDNPITAQAIANQIGLQTRRTLTGRDLDEMDDGALADVLDQPVLFARTKPAHKIRLVRALQARRQIVAMTGDGVNDAPALKQADIGIAMGGRGTEVARDSSDLVLLDDNFATIVAAISEGRRQFNNIRKFVRYLLTSNAGEVLAILANIMIGGPLVFLATQILWMNLVTDGITAVALGLEKSEPDQMKTPPREIDTPIIGWNGMAVIVIFALYTGGASLWVFYQTLPFGTDIARTAAFSAMVVFEKMSVFAFRSLRHSCSTLGWFSNPVLLGALALTLSAQVAAVYWPPLQTVLHTVPLGVDNWIMIAVLALPLIVVPELFKWIVMRRNSAPI